LGNPSIKGATLKERRRQPISSEKTKEKGKEDNGAYSASKEEKDEEGRPRGGRTADNAVPEQERWSSGQMVGKTRKADALKA